MAKNDAYECRDCRYFTIDLDDRGICFSCKKGIYSKIHFFIDACSAFEEKEEGDCEID